jgi:ADP-ribose pyrophosphatase
MKKFTRIDTVVQKVGERFKNEVVIKKFQTEDGLKHEFTTWGEEGSRAGVVIALTADKKVIVVYQFRGGPERWMYEIPGGGIKEGEDPQTGVLRELEEESGYIPGNITFLGNSYGESLVNTTWYYYLATDCVPSPRGRKLDEEELEQGAEVQLIAIAEFLDHAKHGDMTDPTAVLMAYDTLKELS